jgi:hypothetical protein
MTAGGKRFVLMPGRSGRTTFQRRLYARIIGKREGKSHGTTPDWQSRPCVPIGAVVLQSRLFARPKAQDDNPIMPRYTAQFLQQRTTTLQNGRSGKAIAIHDAEKLSWDAGIDADETALNKMDALLERIVNTSATKPDEIPAKATAMFEIGEYQRPSKPEWTELSDRFVASLVA